MEDVDYLLSHGEKQSFQFMIDSRNRDKTLYPTPSDYVISFTTPFTNVVAVDVIEASIPRTNYNVDDSSREVRFALDGTPTPVTIRVLPGTSVLTALNTAIAPVVATVLPGNMLSSVVTSTYAPVVSIVAAINASATTPNGPNGPEASFLLFTSPVPFKLDFTASTAALKNALGFNPAHVGTTIFSSFPNTGTPTQYALIPPSIEPFNAKALQLAAAAAAPASLSLTLASVSDVVLPTGDYDVITLTSALSTAFAPVKVKSTSVPAEVKSTLTFAGPRAFTLGFGLKNAAGEVLGFDAPSTLAGVSDGYACGGDMTTFASVPQADGTHALVAPGIYSLVGDRYVLLRCAEVETSRDAMTELYAPGIAKFTLGVVGYTNATVDFARGGVREFHPIGRLSRLSLQFQRPDGTLYNFRGVNHTLTMVVRYWAPKRETTFQRSTLNPNYDGNFVAWPRTDEEREGDSDEETEAYNANPLHAPPLFQSAARAEGRALPENQAAKRAEILRHLLQ